LIYFGNCYKEVKLTRGYQNGKKEPYRLKSKPERKVTDEGHIAADPWKPEMNGKKTSKSANVHKRFLEP
jgi:hypothetical protein